MHTARVVDLVGRLLKEFAARIVRDRDQIDHMVDPLEMRGLQTPAVGFHDLKIVMAGQKIRPEEQPVEDTNLITVRQQHRHQGRSNIAAAAGDQNTFHISVSL